MAKLPSELTEEDFDKDHCSRWSGIPNQDKLTPFHRKAIELLVVGFGTGVYNLQINWKKAEFRGGAWQFVVVTIRNDISTFDFAKLTNLVIAAHDYCIRVNISAKAPKYLEVMMHPRQREGNMAQRHPTIEQAIEMFRSRR